MKKFWWILSLLFGILFFALGCVAGVDVAQYLGAILIFPGLVGLLDKIWPEEVEVQYWSG